ncbi:MAG TPA: FKBP-type peptidyl-prolyl cis-trans isomerase [Vicinamibacterales bacterium]|nr:FKBP-type peptidyl-prolyl cis-trans isomerase [Vicinamibacterales bacterium]
MRLTFCFVLVALSLVGCGSDNGGGTPTAPSVNVPFSATDLRVGTGAEATNGRTVRVNYSGWLYSTTAVDNKGSLFDSSLSAGRTPFEFVLGTGNVIQGWHRGIPGMRVGGLRRLVIPPDLAYGAAGRSPSIPGNATLLFEVELLAVQ